jgi:hypothetical protein
MSYVVNDGAVREDLLDVLTNISPTDTQLISGLGVTKANSTRHEWLQDTLPTVKTNAFLEAADVSYNTLTNPSRVINYTQIFRQAFKIGETERAVNTAGFNDRYQYEAAKAMKVIKNDMEFAAMRGSILCGSGTVVGQMRGIKNWVSIVSTHSGISLSEDMLNTYFQTVWNFGAEIDAVYVPMVIKRRISGFTAGSTKQTQNSDKRLVNTVSVYEADAARMVKLFPHRHVTISGDLNQDVVGLSEDYWKIAYLRNPHKVDRPSTGDFAGGEIIAEATLECRSGYSGFNIKACL